MVLEEIYRFENGMIKKDGELCREFDRLFKEVVNAGPGEATAIGNITAQMLKAEEFKTIEEARQVRRCCSNNKTMIGNDDFIKL